MTSQEFVDKCRKIAQSYMTVYMWGTFGGVVTPELISQKAKQYPSHYSPSKRAYLENHGGAWAFDCVGLIKGILWGWCGDKSKSFGGAKYQSNGVADLTASGILAQCTGVSSDFSDIRVGELVYKKGHIGVYLGNGDVAEATPSYSDGVQITACANVKSGSPSTKWEKHGFFKHLDYFSIGERVKFRGNVAIDGVSTDDTPLGWTVVGVNKGKITIDKPYGVLNPTIYRITVEPQQIEKK